MEARPDNSHSDRPQGTKSKTNNNCNPKEKKILVLEIQDPDVATYGDYMQEHVVIYKFMGIWPVVKSLN